MKKAVYGFLLVLVTISFASCAATANAHGSINAVNGYFDVSADEFLQKVNADIIAAESEYPPLPEYTDVREYGALTEYYSVFDDGAMLRVSESADKKVVVATLLLDISQATEQGANYSGYYTGTIGGILNPSKKDALQSIKTGNLAINNIQSSAEGNFFCVVLNEEGVQQVQFYPLGSNQQ